MVETTETSKEVTVTAPKKISAWEGFQSELKARADDIASQLPSNVSRDRFINAAIAAVKQTPDLLKADARSLFAAVTKAAQDGLVPDGREGIITVYGATATWNPMVFGLRKRAREIDGIIVDAQVIHENDVFEWGAGDDPHINHKIKLGDRGEMIGAYAIFKNAQEGILHREVMDRAQIEATRDQSKAKNSLMWTKFETEGWRKTVARRGFKSVPCSAPLQQLVQRDDENFDFTPVIAPPPPPAAPPPAAKPAADDFNNDDSGVASNSRHEGETPDAFLDRLHTELLLANDAETVEEIFDTFEVQAAFPEDSDDKHLSEAFAIKNKRLDEIKGKKK